MQIKKFNSLHMQNESDNYIQIDRASTLARSIELNTLQLNKLRNKTSKYRPFRIDVITQSFAPSGDRETTR